MSEGITLKRIIDMDEATELTSSDYALVDSATGGPKKFALGGELSSLKEDISHIGGLSEDIKQAMLQIARKVTYVDEHGQDYYDDLYDALYPPADLVRISAVYTQSGTVYDTDALDSLKSDLTVTAIYSDSSTATVTNYMLSGTLTAGTSTITVSYGGKTSTFSVNVTHLPANLIYSWDLTESLVDSVAGVSAVTTATQGSTGLVFDVKNQYCDFGAIYQSGRTYELDIASITTPATESNRRILVADVDPDTAYGGGSGLIFSGQAGRTWTIYTGSAWSTITGRLSTDVTFFNGKTIRVYVDEDMIWHIYCKDTGSSDPFVLFGTGASAMRTYTNGHVYIGGSRDDGVAPATFTGFRVYEGEVE